MTIATEATKYLDELKALGYKPLDNGCSVSVNLDSQEMILTLDDCKGIDYLSDVPGFVADMERKGHKVYAVIVDGQEDDTAISALLVDAHEPTIWGVRQRLLRQNIAYGAYQDSLTFPFYDYGGICFYVSEGRLVRCSRVMIV